VYNRILYEYEKILQCIPLLVSRCLFVSHRSVVQGSVPGLFLVFIADLKALSDDNSLIKFADDCTLDVQVYLLRQKLCPWSVANKLCLSKTKEIVFR